jgi:hypothetical protein
MLRHDLDVIVVPAAVHFLILDAQVRKVDLIVEVRQVVLERPDPDLFVSPIRMSVVVGAVAVPFVKPGLVVTLELVIEDDSIDACAALRETLCVAFVRPIDLEVVFTLSLAFETVPERLTAPWSRSRRCSSRLRPSFVSATACSREPGTRTVVIRPCSRRCRRSPERGSAPRPW